MANNNIGLIDFDRTLNSGVERYMRWDYFPCRLYAKCSIGKMLIDNPLNNILNANI